MERLNEIETRMAAITAELDTEGADLDALEAEVRSLNTEKTQIAEAIEKRKAIVDEVTKNGVVIKTFEERKDANMNYELMAPCDIRGTEEYRNAFLKGLQGKSLNEVEKRAYEMASTDVAGVIPTMTQERIFNKLKQYAPLMSEITLLQVPGNVTFAIEGTNTAAAKHAENDTASPAADTMISVSLGGYEIIKVLRISKTVQAMAINAFETWLVDILGENIAAKIGEMIIYGDGSSDPKGIDYAQSWTDATNAVIPAAAKYPTPAELVELVSYLKGGYHRNAKWLMNSTDFWGGIVAAQDNSKYKILTDDYTRLLGYPILLDDNVLAGDIFFGDFKKVVGNLSQNITVDRSTESGFLSNSIDYRGTAIFDCDIAVDEAFVKCAKVLTAGA